MKTKRFTINKINKINLINFFKSNNLKKSLKTQIQNYLKEIENNGSIILKNYPLTKNYIKDFKKFSSLFGIVHKQNKEGMQVVKIENEKKKWNAKNRGYKTSEKLDLHTDGGKISMLLCINNSLNGGENLKLDAETIYSRLDESLKKKLYNGFKYHTRHEAKSRAIITKKKYPIFFFNKKNTLHCMYNSKPILEAIKHTKLKDDLKTINKFKKIIENLKKNYEIFKINPGEIWIVNNFKVLHGRKKFKDINEKRLLLRSWVSPKKFKYKGKTILDAYNDR